MAITPPAGATGPESFDNPAQRWRVEIDAARGEQVEWENQVRWIRDRYRDEGRGRSFSTQDRPLSARMNLLWSNIQTLHPALYAQPPVVVVRRRYNTQDDIGRTAATILQRVIEYDMHEQHFHSRMNEALLDHLLAGRGTLWVRYVPRFGPPPVLPGGADITGSAAGPPQNPLGGPGPAPLAPFGGAGPVPIGNISDVDDPEQRNVQVATTGVGEDPEYLAWEEVAIDHVTWDDFLASPARTWEEVRWVARRVYMTKDEIAERFGRKLADAVPLDWAPKSRDGDNRAMMPERQVFKRAQVYEIWDKPSRKAVWLAYGYSEKLLDERDDPLRLEDFFPTPRPLYATLTNDTLVPVPDFRLYRDQAIQIDTLTTRIEALSRAIKVVGVYDAVQEGVQRMLQEGVENQLIPVHQWGALAQQGGLKGSLDLLDISTLAAVLQQLVEVRAQVKQDLYEVTGISDIIRGTTAATETATAQQLKAGFGTMRLRARQTDVNRFVRDMIRLIGEVACEHFHPRTLLAMSEIQLSADAQFAAPALALLKDERIRPFRLDMEADSTILANQQTEQQGRLQFLTAAGQFIGQMVPLLQQTPQLAPLAGQMLLFGVRSFPQGAELEETFESAVDQLQQALKQGKLQPPPQPGQDGQTQQAQAQMQQAQIADIQSKIQARQAEQQRDQMDLQSKIAERQGEAQRRGAETINQIHGRQYGSTLDAIAQGQEHARALLALRGDRMDAAREHARKLLELHGGRVDAAREFMLKMAQQQQAQQDNAEPQPPEAA